VRTGGAGYASAPPAAVRLYGLVFVIETHSLSILGTISKSLGINQLN